MQEQTNTGLNAQDQAYIRMLELHFGQFIGLLHNIGGTEASPGMYASRELSIAHTKLEEAFFHAREFVLRRAAHKAKLN